MCVAYSFIIISLIWKVRKANDHIDKIKMHFYINLILDHIAIMCTKSKISLHIQSSMSSYMHDCTYTFAMNLKAAGLFLTKL